MQDLEMYGGEEQAWIGGIGVHPCLGAAECMEVLFTMKEMRLTMGRVCFHKCSVFFFPHVFFFLFL